MCETGLGAGEGRGDRAPPARLPLNSKWLKSGHQRRLAKELGVPTAASVDELHQMIDGKLTEEGKETRNIQAMLEGADPTAEFSLVEAEGRFLVVPMEEETHGGTSDLSEHEEEGEQEIDTLQRELEALAEENQALKVEVSALEPNKLHDEKAHFCESWRMNWGRGRRGYLVLCIH